jgi:alpha-N-acetylglucosaminidase
VRVDGPLPVVPSKQRVKSAVAWRYYMNVCTVSYSMAFWDWDR